MNGLDCLKSYLDALLAFSVAFQTQFWDFSGVIHIFGLHEWIKCFLQKQKLIDLAMKNCLQCSMDIHPCVERDWKTRFFATLLLTCLLHSILAFQLLRYPWIFHNRLKAYASMPCLKFKNTFFPMHDACLLWSLQKRKCAILGFYDLNKTDDLKNLRLWAFRPCELR